MTQLAKLTGNSKPKFCSPVGYEVFDIGVATEAMTSGDLVIQGSSGWSKAPAGSLYGDGLAAKDYAATQDNCDFLIQGEMDGFTLAGGAVLPIGPIWPSATVAGGLQTDIPAAVAATNSAQRIVMTGGPAGGSATFEIFGEAAVFTFNMDAAGATAMLEALNAFVPGDVVVTGGPEPGTPLVVTFGGAYAGRPVPDFVLVTNGLTGGTAPTARAETVTVGGSGRRSTMRAVADNRIRVSFV